ncbi:hypothetical protein IV36_GL002044 [Liquorilactobacillus mali]|uniref:Uncharacterized protein n=1 Tax=Liquorilactobacillus mali TaxID=1618 RepID=A0A0R2FST8_9LACO|nr:hypothetical protein IV36_GL002044 [Liquorilactobacillus mali]
MWYVLANDDVPQLLSRIAWAAVTDGSILYLIHPSIAPEMISLRKEETFEL